MNFTEIKHDYVWGPAVEANSHSQNCDDLLAGISIDAWKTGNDDEQGTVVANVLLTQRGDIVVDFHDNGVRMNEQVQEHIAAAQCELEKYGQSISRNYVQPTDIASNSVIQPHWPSPRW